MAKRTATTSGAKDGEARRQDGPTVEVLPPEPDGAGTALEPVAAPGELAVSEALAARLRRLADEGTAPNTRRAHQGDLRYFRAWADAAGHPADLPIPGAVLLQFIADHVDGELSEDVDRALCEAGVKAAPGAHSIRTVGRRVSSLSKAHELAGFGGAANPCKAAPVRELLAACRRRAAAKGAETEKKQAVTRDVLAELLRHCGTDAAGIRDRALLLVGAASGGRRRSELVGLNIGDVDPDGDGYAIHVRRSKTDQEGTGAVYPVQGLAALALDRWLGLLESECGPLEPEAPLFRSVDRWGNIGPGRLSGRAVALVVQRRAEAAGLDPDRFGAHSLRSGFVTQAGKAGVPLERAMDLSGHRSAAVARDYYQRGALADHPAARVFD